MQTHVYFLSLKYDMISQLVTATLDAAHTVKLYYIKLAHLHLITAYPMPAKVFPS